MTIDEGLRVANIASPFILGGIGWLLRNAMGRVTDRIERLEALSVRNEEAIDACSRREDCIRADTRITQKLDKLCDGQARIEATINVGNTVAAAVKDLANAIQGSGHADD